ncbi:MAG: hypothetical protein UY12_C0031G0007 [Parcubacteria group bacterium GW2011_GWA2_47_8b]|uniref:Uncharacterized protein n=1 Tax=Candidatus Giovannonibacteria bacterium GW2011_GWB1_47_6b TaxID=1618655 RepID=A0A0G1T6N6_9BACT|nr:MAG: hypothetical protein UY02_C0001G0017 [Candidatus Giovannonibacteria bacterium GW2011_GWB1_47_6b]KKU83743.1 MAG: hypothetical protein UY12_C0031G0007 [Parcubacteria group bacterium GW2011_GWA2_47_8b]KKU93124.1 MAG: hypothetical protein UY24_C0025G0010 [Parcubacteria group bacterium GW2011_GWA1_48_11b]
MTRKCVTDDQYGQLQRRLDEVARRVDEGTLPFDSVMRALQSFIEGKFRFGDGDQKKAAPAFKPWRTLKLGTGLQTADNFRQDLKKSGNKISDWANDILGRPAFKAASEETEVDLYILTTAELTGEKDGGTTAEVFAGAKRLGFEKCPAEVGPQLRIQYPDQPMNERLLIGMEPITDSDGFLYVFCVERDGYGQWLYTDCGSAGSVWNGNDRWVFILRK